MQKTEYLKLNKPDSTDFFSVDHQNQNMELIDEEFAKKADKKEIENIKSDLTTLNNSKLKGYVLGYTVPANTGGWHKIAQITGGYFNFDLYATGNWLHQRKSNAHFQIQNINGTVRIVQLSGLSDSGGGITKIRMVRVVDDRDTWILEENSTPTNSEEFFRFIIAGYVTVTPLDGIVDTSSDFKDSVSLEVSDVPTGTVITTSNVDSALSSTSTHPVENKVVKAEFDKVNSNLSDLGKCKNLLRPISQTITLNGVTCTYNGDGTYTLNGTATAKTFFNFILNYGFKKDTKILGCPPNGSADSFGMFIYNVVGGYDYGDGFTFKEDVITRAGIYINSGYTCDNITFKPMLTTNLDTTYDDFVPYTGDGDTLTADVADINENLKVVSTALEDKANISIYGDDSVSLGRKSGTDVGTNSFAFGLNITASGSHSHAEGRFATASNIYSHAEGDGITASGDYSHAEGLNTTASGSKSYAFGFGTTASGNYSHAEGLSTTAIGKLSHAEGDSTIASNYASHVMGKYNVGMTTGGGSSNKTGHVFVIGNGTPSNLSNAFSVMYSGVVKAASTITASTTADYAEFFEWEDGNPDAEDRVGKFVTLNGDKISIATSNEDYILGIVSGEPFVLGNGDCDTWNGMYLRDEFGRTILEPAPKIEIDEETGEEKEVLDEDGNIIYEGTRPVLNPDYDPTQQYISRFDRLEWSPVGMLGVLSVIQDGTCKVNGYCCCNSEGIATSCDRNTEGACRIIEVINDKVARVIFR